MLRPFTAFAAACLASITLAAQAAPASPESIDRLFTLMKTESTMDQMYVAVEQMMRRGMNQAVQGQPVTAEQQRTMDAVIPKFMTVMRQEMSWDKLKPQLIQVYAETYQQDEIDGLTAFYASPTGQAFVAKMPIVMQKSFAVTQSMMQSVMPRMTEAMKQAIEDAKTQH